MKVFYLRVSTSNQNLESQRLALQNYAVKNSVDYVEIVDEGTSGSKFDRVGLNKVLEGVTSGKITEIICYSLSRVTRSLVDLMALLKILEKHNCNLVSLTEQFDLKSNFGQLMIKIIVAIAELEKSVIKDRCKSGIAAYREKHNGKWGAPKKINGELIRELRAQGFSYRKISKLLNISLGSISGHLHNQQYVHSVENAVDRKGA